MCFTTAGGRKISRRKPSLEVNLVTRLGTPDSVSLHSSKLAASLKYSKIPLVIN